MNKYVALLILLASISACSIHQSNHERFQPKRQQIVEKSFNDLESASVCCNKYSELQFFPAEPKTELSGNLSIGQQAYKFSSGKSFAFPVQLPHNPVASVSIKAFMVGKMATEVVALYPKIVFLNSEFSFVEEISAHAYEVKQEFISGDRYFYGEFKLPKDARYLIIFTSPDLYGKGFPYDVGGGIAPVGGTGLFVPLEKYEFSVPYMLTGRVSVTFN